METLIVAQVSSAMLLAIVLAFAPTRAAAGTFFAVRVSAAYRATPDAGRLLWRFRAALAVQAVLCCTLSRLLPPPWGAVAGTSLQLGVGWWSYVRTRRQVLEHALPALEAGAPSLALEPASERLPGGWILQGLPYLMLLASGVVLALAWGELPERYPTHWLASGEPNAWAEKRAVVVYGALAFGASILAVLGFSAWLTLRFSRSGNAAERGARRLTLNVLLGSEYLVAVVFSVISLTPLAGASGRTLMLLLGLGLPPLLIVGVVALLATHRPAAPADGATPVDDASGAAAPDASEAHWKGAGAFYENPADPALFVPKRFGIGYTLNFGHPAAYGVLFVLVGVPLVGALLLGLAMH